MDLNQDGGVTIFDFLVFAQNFGSAITPSTGLRPAVAAPLFAAEQDAPARVPDLSNDERRFPLASSADRAAALQVVLTEWSREVWSGRGRELPGQIALRDPQQVGERDEMLGGDDLALEQLLNANRGRPMPGT